MHPMSKVTITHSPTGLSAEINPKSPDSLICDFCSDRPVVAAFPAVRATLTITSGNTDVTHGTDERWAACKFCEECIRANRRSTLLDHAVRMIRNQLGEIPVSLARKMIGETHAMYWRNRVREN
jgi:hypothetical protein